MAVPKTLKIKINDITKKTTNFYDFAEPYQLFEKLKVQADVELEEIDFYGGYRIPNDEFLLNSPAIRNELARQRMSNVRDRTDLDRILNNYTNGHICFVGPAGIGKTTLMKSIARNVLDKKYNGLNDIEIVHFVQCRHYKPGNLLTVGEFLFGSTGMPVEEIQTAIKFAVTHPNKILFVLDSLDTLLYSVDGVYQNISINEKAGPGAILWNILSGKVFNGCRIITSSREHSIRNYIGEIRPQKVYILLGFNVTSIKQVITGYVGTTEANDIMTHLEKEIPAMLALCNTPVILVYTLIAFKAESSLVPTTMTRVMVIVLQSILRSPHTNHHEIMDAMHKLGQLSHTGNVERRVLFFADDFQRVGLDPEMAVDLAVVAPGGFSQTLVRGESVLFFSHQTFQEMLGALWLAGGGLDALKEFAESSINIRHFAVVRRFIYGILLDEEAHDTLSQDLLEDDGDYEAKVKFIKENLLSQLQSGLDEYDFLEILISMNEAKDGVDDVIKASVPHVSLLDIPLSSSDLYAVGSVISRRNDLQTLDLCNCSLDSSSMRVLATTIKGSNVKVTRLILAENVHLGVEGLSAAGEIVSKCQTKDLIMSSCDLSGDEMQALARTTRNAKTLAKVHLNGNENLGIDGVSAVGDMMTQCDGEEVDLSKCNLSSEHLKAFANSTKTAKSLRRLYLSDNKKLGAEGIFIAGEIVTQRNVEHLHLCVCKLSGEDLKTLATSTTGARMLKILNLSEDREASHEDILSVTNLLHNVAEDVRLFKWKIRDEDEQTLQDELNKLDKTDLRVYLAGGIVLTARTEELKTKDPQQTTMAVVSSRKSGDHQARLSAEMDRQIKAKKTECKIVGPQGGSVENMRCDVTFLSESFNKDTEVTTSVLIDFADCPPNRFLIAPIFQCVVGEKLNRPARLQLESWLAPTADEFTAEVYRKDTESSEWQFVQHVSVGKNRMITFFADHFTLFEVVVEYASWIWRGITRPFVEISIENLFYIGSVAHNIVCVSYLTNAKLEEDVSRSFRHLGYSRLLALPETVLAKRNSELKVSVRCVRPRNLNIVLENDDEDNERVVRVVEKVFLVREIMRALKATHYFPITLRDGDLRHCNHALTIKLAIKTDEREINHTVSKEWPLRDVRLQRVTHVHNYYGAIKGNKVVMPTGVLNEANINERNVFDERQ